MNAITLLRKDHETVRGLFEEPIGEGDMRALFAALVAGVLMGGGVTRSEVP